MEEFEEPLQAFFAEHVDCVYRTLDAAMPSMDAVVARLCNSMLQEHKLLVCGSGTATAVAQAFSATLLARTHIDRPALPVFNLGADAVAQSAISAQYAHSDSLARQVQALGQSGDTLLMVGGFGESAALVTALRAAHDAGIHVVALTADASGGDLAAHLDAEDIELRVPSNDPMRVIECQLLILNSLISLIETELFAVNG